MLVRSLIVRTYTPAEVGSSDELNTLAQREVEADARVQSQRVSAHCCVGLVLDYEHNCVFANAMLRSDVLRV